MSSVITVENLSKKYIISHQKQERYTALRDVLADAVKRGIKKLLPHSNGSNADPTHEEFWAIKGVTVKVMKRFMLSLSCLRGRDGEGEPADASTFILGSGACAMSVSFDIQQCDQVGVIGRNGAGKSTLLKILIRITEPTSGKVSIKGCVASLDAVA